MRCSVAWAGDVESLCDLDGQPTAPMLFCVTLTHINDNCLSNVLIDYAFLWEVRHAPTGEPG
jgi:hypothetical protein